MTNNNIMSRDEVIERYVNHLEGDELRNIMSYIYSYDGTFDNLMWYPMDELNELLDGRTLLDVLEMAHFGEFNPADDYFRLDAYENLESADAWQANNEAADYISDVIEWCVNSSVGETGDDTLDAMIEADSDAVFDTNYEEVDMEE